MLQTFFHAWERRLASVTTDRVVRPFEWGLDWIPRNGNEHAAPPDAIGAWVAHAMADSDAFYDPGTTSDYELGAAAADGERLLTFPSAFTTPHPENNTVYARLFPVKHESRGPRAAVIVLPQWNSDPGGHAGLCRLLAMNGMTALRLSLPYHDRRMPPLSTSTGTQFPIGITRRCSSPSSAVPTGTCSGPAKSSSNTIPHRGRSRPGTSITACRSALTATAKS